MKTEAKSATETQYSVRTLGNGQSHKEYDLTNSNCSYKLCRTSQRRTAGFELCARCSSTDIRKCQTCRKTFQDRLLLWVCKNVKQVRYNIAYITIRAVGTTVRAVGTAIRAVSTAIRAIGTTIRAVGTTVRAVGTTVRAVSTTVRAVGTAIVQ